MVDRQMDCGHGGRREVRARVCGAKHGGRRVGFRPEKDDRPEVSLSKKLSLCKFQH